MVYIGRSNQGKAVYLYNITNSLDNKQYVGITNNIKRRWKEHRTDLRGNRHGNKHLQAAWNLYGEENFKFKIINKFNSLEEMNKAEMNYIKDNNLLDSDFGYNLDTGGIGSFIHTESAKKRISKSQEKAVVSMCLKTGKIKHYQRVKDVEMDGFNPKSIGNACTDRSMTYKKHIWMYKKDYDKYPDKLVEKMENRQNVKARPSRYRKVFSMNIETKEIVEYDAIYHSKKDGFNYTTVYKCCINPNVSKSHKGHIWSFNKNDLISKRETVLKNKTHKVVL